jgi:hypothetical protein
MISTLISIRTISLAAKRKNNDAGRVMRITEFQPAKTLVLYQRKKGITSSILLVVSPEEPRELETCWSSFRVKSSKHPLVGIRVLNHSHNSTWMILQVRKLNAW